MTLALAIIGVVLSMASLAWQAFIWRHNGPVLRVTSAYSIPVFNDSDLGEDHISVTVTNAGRAPTTVTGWGIDMGGQKNMQVVRPVPFSAPLPHRLEGGAEVTFFVAVQPLRDYRASTGLTFDRMKPWVRAAGDRKHFAKKGVPLAD